MRTYKWERMAYANNITQNNIMHALVAFMLKKDVRKMSDTPHFVTVLFVCLYKVCDGGYEFSMVLHTTDGAWCGTMLMQVGHITVGRSTIVGAL